MLSALQKASEAQPVLGLLDSQLKTHGTAPDWFVTPIPFPRERLKGSQSPRVEGLDVDSEAFHFAGRARSCVAICPIFLKGFWPLTPKRGKGGTRRRRGGWGYQTNPESTRDSLGLEPCAEARLRFARLLQTVPSVACPKFDPGGLRRPNRGRGRLQPPSVRHF